MFILLLLFSWTPLLRSQCVDTGCFYNVKSLQKIATKLIKCKEDSILFSLTSKQLILRDSSIVLKDLQIKSLEKQVNLYEVVVIGKNSEISKLNEQLVREGKKLKLTKALWGGSTALLVAALGYSLFR